jgi:hypothetical protein
VIRTFKKLKRFQFGRKKKKLNSPFAKKLHKKAPGNVRGYKQCWAVLDFYEETPVSAL